MLIKKFVGRDERIVMQRVRTALGPEAVILHTSVVRPTGALKWLRSPRVEVVAGAGFRIVNGEARKAAPPAAAPAAEPRIPELLHAEFQQLKGILAKQGEMLRQDRLGDVPQELSEEYLALTTSEVSQRLARKMVQHLREKLPAAAKSDRAAIRGALRDALRDVLRCTDGLPLKEGRCTRVAFIGPTGVGKTTTIAKLMAVYTHRGARVGVVANDTYRIAASDQIRRIAELVGVPVKVCPAPADVAEAVRGFESMDLVLIDTAGRSQKNARSIAELQEVLRAASPHETHLVLSMTTQLKTLLDIIEQFTPCGYQRIAFTKLDEAVKAGLILDVLSNVGSNLSFITTGQEIPRDIEIADPDRLSALILGEEGLATT